MDYHSLGKTNQLSKIIGFVACWMHHVTASAIMSKSLDVIISAIMSIMKAHLSQK